MDISVKRKIRDYIKVTWSILFFWLYIPHLIAFIFIDKEKRLDIVQDVDAMLTREYITLPRPIALLYFLHSNRYYRNVFYYRIGPIMASLIGWYRLGDRYFEISQTIKLGGGIIVSHAFSTELNADSIGKNFNFRHCTTLGAKPNGRPTIGDNVYLGASVTIIGPVHVGNNVVVGAGSVVVKDVPNNAIVAGNPARVIRYREPDEVIHSIAIPL